MPAAYPSVFNGAYVSGGGDGDTSNNSASDVAVVKGPDAKIVKSHSGNFAVGATGSYTLAVSNIGTADASGVAVTDALPAGLGFASATGNGWSCGESGQTVTCNYAGSLTAGASSNITLTVSVFPAAFPSVANSASISAPNDVGSGNNSSSDTTQVVAPDLRILPDVYTAGYLVQLLFMNPGAGTASVTVTYLLQGATPIVESFTLGAGLPKRITVNSDSRLANQDMSVIVSSSLPIVAQKSMSWSASMRGGMVDTLGGDGVLGSPRALTRWYLAEGSTAGWKCWSRSPGCARVPIPFLKATF